MKINSVNKYMKNKKTLAEVSAISKQGFGEFRGYEMHIGKTFGPDCERPFGSIKGRDIGAVSENGRVSGCYVHGLFANDNFRHALLASIKNRDNSAVEYERQIEKSLDILAGSIEKAIDIDALLSDASC